MRGRWVVLGALVCGVTACGGDDNADLFGAGGSNTGGSSAGGAGGGAGAGGSAGVGGGAGAGGSGTGGTSIGGSGGTTAGGTGGSSAGGSGGTTSGGSGGTTSGGSGGTTSGGSGGTTSGGSGGTTSGGTGGISLGGSGGSGGSGGGCIIKQWCKDNDNDSYGSPSGLASSCYKPSGNWIELGSKPRACEDCNDAVKEAFPSSTHCSATGYSTAGGISFDYNCDTKEDLCSDIKKAGQCAPDPNDPTQCIGEGYLPVNGSSAKNKFCGSVQWQACVAVTVGLDAGGPALACNSSVKSANPVTCK